MIKRLLLLAIGLSALTACAPAPAPAPVVDTAAEEAKLKADALIWFDHYNKGDADAVANLYAEDAILMPPAAPKAIGRPAIRAFIATDSAATKAAGLTLKNESVTGSGIVGETGWISGTFAVVDAKGATVDTGKYLSVHHRTNGAWLYIRDIWNSDAPAPPPPPAPKKSK